MSTLTIEDVERIARLANLELTQDEKQLFTKQLADILAYAEQVQARRHDRRRGHGARQCARRRAADEPKPSLEVSEAVANAPDAAPEAGLFRVPRVIG